MRSTRSLRLHPWKARVDVAMRRSAEGTDEWVSAKARHLQATLSPARLPYSVWDRSRGAPGAADGEIAQRLLPLPAAAALVRALGGGRRPSLDVGTPLGPAAGGNQPIFLLPSASIASGGWEVGEAVAFITRAEAMGPGQGLRWLIAVSRGGEEKDAARKLRTALRGSGRRALVVPVDPGWEDDETSLLLAGIDAAHAVLVSDAAAIASTLSRLAAAAGRAVVGPAECRKGAASLTAQGRAARLALVRRSGDSPPAPAFARFQVVAQPRRVVLAGHDLKFAGPLKKELERRGHEVRVDTWTGHERHDLEQSSRLADWADVVHCEWSLGNLVWYSRTLPSETRLTARTHLQEAGTPFPARTRVSTVDAWIFVADHVRAQVLRDAAVPPSIAHVVHNHVDDPGQAVRARAAAHPDRRFNLGLVGVIPERKGLDRALDLLLNLRRLDDRFTLRIRGHRPEESAWMAGRRDAARYYQEQSARMAEDPLLADAVRWDPFGSNMGQWYTSVGTVVSLSSFESFHYTLPDGAAHGCLPRSLAWAGADLLYPTEWLAPDVEVLAEEILSATETAEIWAAAACRAAEHVRSRFSPELTTWRLADLVLGGR